MTISAINAIYQHSTRPFVRTYVQAKNLLVLLFMLVGAAKALYDLLNYCLVR